MPSQRRLFMPADGLSIRDPLTNERAKGNIMNPRRYAEFGGLHSASKPGWFASTATLGKPGSTERSVPVKS